MIPFPIYHNINTIDKKDSEKKNLCYIVTPSTSSVKLPTSSSIGSTMINNYEHKYMTDMNITKNQSVIPDEHSLFMKRTSFIDMSTKADNNTIINTTYIRNTNQNGSVQSLHSNTIQHNNNISILENSKPTIQIPQQQNLTYIQNNNCLLLPINIQSSTNNRTNDLPFNINFSANRNSSYNINTSTYYCQDPTSQNTISQPSVTLTPTPTKSIIIGRPYISTKNSDSQQSLSNNSNNQQIQTGYMQGIQNQNIPIIFSIGQSSSTQNQIQQQDLTLVQNENQQSVQLTAPQIQTTLKLTQSIATYTQPTVINNYHNDNIIKFNNAIPSSQNQIYNNVVIYDTNVTNNYSYSVNPINSINTIPINNNNQNINSKTNYNLSVTNQPTKIYNSSNSSTKNNYSVNHVSTIPRSNLDGTYVGNPVNIDNSNVKNNYQNLEYIKFGNFYNTFPYKKNSSKDEVRQQKVRFEGDMYTPKLVRYSGNTKEGFCDQCNPGRWLQLKNSAYWYHKQFFHGISSVSGKPFRSPLATKILDYAEILDVVNEFEKKNIKEYVLDNEQSKKETGVPSFEKNDLSVATSNNKFSNALKDLVAESSINFPEGSNLDDYILKSVVGLCHHCKKWIPLMITKKRSSQFFTNILKYKQNDGLLIENNKKNEKSLNKYYLKKKYNIYNDKKSITEMIVSYLQHVWQNKKEINDIINNNGMTILWYRHAHKCHQYLRPKLNIENCINKNKTPSDSKYKTTTDTTDNKELNKNNNKFVSTVINNSSTSLLSETNTNSNSHTVSSINNINSQSQSIFNNSIHTIRTSTIISSTVVSVASTNINNNNISLISYSTNNNKLVNEITTPINTIQTQTHGYHVNNNINNNNNKRMLISEDDVSVYNDYKQVKKEKIK
ncbi:hypothetical protein H8356DRAFT_1000873 [Neocallimastix lanati (nom. inval.)]|nr:hypothetical protein H8356DRAFT_1000873 [Neocallimastix sp. JGI-2020a]